MQTVLPAKQRAYCQNDCFCLHCEPHATQLPTASNTHYLCDIIPPSDRLRHPANCFRCCSACVSLSSLCFLVHINIYALELFFFVPCCMCLGWVDTVPMWACMCVHQFTILFLTFQVYGCYWSAHQHVQAEARDVLFLCALQEDGVYTSVCMCSWRWGLDRVGFVLSWRSVGD